MLPRLTPDPELRRRVENQVHADSHLCWTCGACLNECPVNLATNRLHPLKVVRLANFGFLDDLLHLPEIWYCLTCRRCDQVCPMAVKPAALIGYARQEAVRRDIVSYETLRRYKALFAEFQRVRYQAARACRRDCSTPLPEPTWDEWFETPVKGPTSKIFHGDLFSKSPPVQTAAATAGTAACFTCGECSSACPVFLERSLFDPVWIFRMVNLGLVQELLESASIWLCIACRRCTEACSQKVEGHLIIRGLQEIALAEGIVDRAYPLRLQAAAKMIYARLLHKIDKLFGFPQA